MANQLSYPSLYSWRRARAGVQPYSAHARRPDTSRIWGNSGTDMWRLQGGNFTSLPQHFRDAGYIVLGTGKIYHPVPAMNYDSKYSWSPEALP